MRPCQLRGIAGATGGLLRACHPGPSLAVTGLTALLTRATAGRGARVARVTVAVGLGQLLIGWTNDLVDERRDRQVGRTDKPVASGAVSRPVVTSAAGLAGLGCVGMSLSCGRRSALVHLTAGVGSGLAYDLGLKTTVGSVVPFAVAFGTLPAVVSLASPQPALPPWRVSTAAALLGIGAHLANALPDLTDDTATGVTSLPQRLGARRCTQLTAATLLGSTAVLLAGGGAAPLRWVMMTGATSLAVIAGRGSGRTPFAAAVALAFIDGAILVLQSPRADRPQAERHCPV
ncbi:UbiA family prenyltransferase [Rudaeicoccus suwonensis]|uniref:4-hydroxybenzoate polyprenyltransferase n=1 Tax=Rudaeicoccus suwonensis TaxID=657409 RepID=A0A561E8G9_9MICO|nr:UbiA family prenyltransferase [Rudaeicoccus suwonensis]TWE11903.1 4-hydroxybenzoate polyprenyltransferase [Rudaeicoccus suwonensis]